MNGRNYQGFVFSAIGILYAQLKKKEEDDDPNGSHFSGASRGN